MKCKIPLALLIQGALTLAFLGCYSGADLSPREFNAIQRSAATLSPMPLISDRAAAGGASLGAAAAEGTWQILHEDSSVMERRTTPEEISERERRFKRQQRQLDEQGEMLREIEGSER